MVVKVHLQPRHEPNRLTRAQPAQFGRIMPQVRKSVKVSLRIIFRACCVRSIVEGTTVRLPVKIAPAAAAKTCPWKVGLFQGLATNGMMNLSA